MFTFHTFKFCHFFLKNKILKVDENKNGNAIN